MKEWKRFALVCGRVRRRKNDIQRETWKKRHGKNERECVRDREAERT